MANVPEIRFKGFTDAWEQRRFEDDMTLVGGATPYKQNIDYWGGDIVWLSSQEIKDRYVASGTYTITKQALNDNATKVVKSGTPLIVTRSGVLANRFPISIPTVDVAINQDIKALVYDKDKINTDYIVAHLQKLEGFILKWVVKGGTTVQSVNVPDLQKIELGYPSVKEQTHIGNFFRTLDNTIAIHKRKLNGLRELKKAYLQVMFPQAGETVPRVRFDGFSEPWELKGADEIFCTVSDKGHSHLPVLSASQEHGMVLRNEIGIDIKFDNTNIATYKRVMPGQFVIHLRSFQGGLAYSKIEGITSPAYTVLDFIEKDKQVSEFWIDALRSEKFIKMLESVTYGIRDGRSISFNDFSIIKLPYPSHDEQTAIGRLFSLLDYNIDGIQSNISNLAKLKSAYLKKMFV